MAKSRESRARRRAERDRHVDIHPIFDDGRAGWWQHGNDDTKFEYPAVVLTTGLIGAVPVQCLTAAKQRDLHAGYELREQDALDLIVLDTLAGRSVPCLRR